MLNDIRADTAAVPASPAAQTPEIDRPTGAYETRVDIDRKGRTYRYPCSIQSMLIMEDSAVKRGLIQQALQMAVRESGLCAIH